MPRALWVLFNAHRTARCFSLCLSFEFSVSISFFLLPSLLLSFSLCLFPPPSPPPLPAVFAGSFSARHPEAAVAPASLPTSVFVVGDDMSKLWRAGEGRERGREREGREGAHHSAWRKSKGPRENVMWPAVRPDILFLSFFLGLSMWAGRNGDRKHPPPPPHPILLPPFILSYPPSALHSLSHSLLMSPPLNHPLFLFPIPPSNPPLMLFLSPLCAQFLLCEFPKLRLSFFPPFFQFACLSHPRVCPCILTHLVCWGVFRCKLWVSNRPNMFDFRSSGITHPLWESSTFPKVWVPFILIVHIFYIQYHMQAHTTQITITCILQTLNKELEIHITSA